MNYPSLFVRNMTQFLLLACSSDHIHYRYSLLVLDRKISLCLLELFDEITTTTYHEAEPQQLIAICTTVGKIVERRVSI